MEPVRDLDKQTDSDHATSPSIKPCIGEPPKLIPSPSNQTTAVKSTPPSLISSRPSCNVAKLVSETLEASEPFELLEQRPLNGHSSVTFNEGVVNESLIDHSLTAEITKEIKKEIIDEILDGVAEEATEQTTKKTDNAGQSPSNLTNDKDKLDEMTAAAATTLNDPASLVGQMTTSDNHCLLDANQKLNGQWSRELGHPDSVFFFEKYFLRGADDHSESMLQDCGQSTFGDHHPADRHSNGHSDGHLIDTHPADSIFKFDEDPADHKPSSTELNYYSSQYQNNPNCFEQQPPHYQHPTQANIYSNLIHSFGPFDYGHSHVHHTLLDGGGGDQLANGQLNGNSTTVTYSNGGMQPISHHHAFKSNGTESDCQPPTATTFYPISHHPSSLQSSNFSGSFSDLSSCDNSFTFHPNFHSTSTPLYRSGLTPHHPISALFDTDAGCIQAEHLKDGLSADSLKARQIKQERLDEFGIRNSLDLVNSNPDHLMDDYPTNEHVVISNNHVAYHQENSPHASAGVVQHPSIGHFYASEPKPSKVLNPMAIQMNASSIVNGSKKLITLKEAANVKLEKVKIERANGMKIYYFKCSLCTYQTNTSQSMKDHLYCIHCKAKNNYRCNICQQTFGWKNNAQRHMRRKHKIEDQTTKREAIITLV